MPADSTTVLNHIISILDCFSIERPELGVRDVARIASLSPSTVGRLMAEMKNAGILQQNPVSRAYSPGSKVLSWSNIYISSLNIRSVALPYMEELRNSTGETVTLYILDGIDRLCVERLESLHNVRMVTRVGGRLPLYAGSAGKAILAFMPREWQEEYFHTVGLKPLTSKTIINAEALRGELEKIRQDGFAVSLGEWILEASGVAAPILGPDEGVLGALSISGPGPRFAPQLITGYAQEVIRVTRSISLLMGARPFIHVDTQEITR